MLMKHKRPFLLSCILVIAFSLIIPAYGEVLSFKTDKTFYGKDSTIVFSGSVEEDDYGEFVTIVIDDPSSEFVQLIQALPDADNKFQKSVDVGKFYTIAGTYNATAFVTAKTNGASVDFDIERQRLATTLSEHENNVVSDTQTNQNTKTNEDEKTIQEKINERIEAAKKLKESQNNVSNETSYDKKTIQEKINERIEAAKKSRESQTSIVNETGDNMTKADSGSNVIIKENKPTGNDSDDDKNKAATTDIVPEIYLGSNLLYIVIGLGGIGVAGAVIYGVKNKSRHKADSSSHYGFEEKTEPSQNTPIQSDDDYALMILKNRLAKGEITVDEFNELKKALKEP